jgi:hypothetical protein
MKGVTKMPSPIDVQKSLAGTDYPARKDELIARAKDNGASGEVMDALQSCPIASTTARAECKRRFSDGSPASISGGDITWMVADCG